MLVLVVAETDPFLGLVVDMFDSFLDCSTEDSDGREAGETGREDCSSSL